VKTELVATDASTGRTAPLGDFIREGIEQFLTERNHMTPELDYMQTLVGKPADFVRNWLTTNGYSLKALHQGPERVFVNEQLQLCYVDQYGAMWMKGAA
jgi:hypothetical protein